MPMIFKLRGLKKPGAYYKHTTTKDQAILLPVKKSPRDVFGRKHLIANMVVRKSILLWLLSILPLTSSVVSQF
jgi:hypothetical protein